MHSNLSPYLLTAMHADIDRAVRHARAARYERRRRHWPRPRRADRAARRIAPA